MKFMKCHILELGILMECLLKLTLLIDLETMATQRKLKYSVSDASRRMYKIETNGIYRKLENPLPSESQLRQQRFEERQRPLSQILASSSFRETLDRNAFSRGQSLSNLKKSRQRNSLNLPNSFSLDLEYDVNANAKTDRSYKVSMLSRLIHCKNVFSSKILSRKRMFSFFNFLFSNLNTKVFFIL